MQRHTVDMNMFPQYVASGAGNVGHNCGFATRQSIQQARFPGIWTPGNDHFHPFAQQAALTRFGAYRVEIVHHSVKLGFDFAIGEEVDLLIREINRRFYVDPQVSKCFHKMIHAGGKSTLQ